jgi:hypothetical protein
MRSFNAPPPQPAIELVFLRPKKREPMNRKSYSRSNSRKQSWTDAAPRWSQAQTDTSNLLARMLFEKLGITDLKSYFEKLLPAIVVCVVLGAGIGAYRDGLSGFFWWGLAGIAAPAALIWLSAVVPYVLLYVAMIFAAWFLLFYAAVFILSH